MTTPPQVTLFCEGNRNSLDARVLEKLIGAGQQTLLIPVGGKRGMKAFMDGYAAQPRVMNNNYYRAFRDRDFDYRVPDSVELICDGQFWVSYRTTIENYLLSPQLLWDYLQSKPKSQPTRRMITSLADAEDIFRSAIVKLRFYSAARWAYGLTKIEQKDMFLLPSNWPYNSGEPPENKQDSDCRSILQDIVGSVKQTAQNLDYGAFESHYSKFLTKFDSAFLHNIGNALIWFNGKDLAKTLHEQLGGNNFFHSKKDGYYDFALDHFSVATFPDLQQLNNILNGSLPI